MSIIRPDRSPPQEPFTSETAKRASYAFVIIAFSVAIFVLVSQWPANVARENIDFLAMVAWSGIAVASAVQLLFRPVRGHVVRVAATGVLAAGALCMLVSYTVANEDLVIGFRVVALGACVGSAILLVPALLAIPFRVRE